MNMGSLYQFLYHYLAFSLPIFAYVSIYFSPLFSFITTFFYRFRRCKAHLNKKSGLSDFSETEQHLESDSDDFKDVFEFPNSENNDEMQKNEFCFTFRFPTYEEFCKSKEEKGEFLSSELKPSTSNNESLTEPEVSSLSFENEKHFNREYFTFQGRPTRCAKSELIDPVSLRYRKVAESTVDRECFTSHNGSTQPESDLITLMNFKCLKAKLKKSLRETQVVETEDLGEIHSKNEVIIEEVKENVGNKKLLDTESFSSHSGPTSCESVLVKSIDFKYHKVKPKKLPMEAEDLKEVHTRNGVFNEEEKGNIGDHKLLGRERFTSHSGPTSSKRENARTETEVIETVDLKEVDSKNSLFTEEEKGNRSDKKLPDRERFTSHSRLTSPKPELVDPVSFRYRMVKPENTPIDTGVVETEDLKEVDSKNDVLKEEEEMEESSCTDSDTVSIGFENMHYLMSKLVDSSYSEDGFLTDEDFVENNERCNSLSYPDSSEIGIGARRKLLKQFVFEVSDTGAATFLESPVNLGNFIEMKEENQESDDDNKETRKLKQRFLSEDDFHEDLDKIFNEWEHQELIEQLKMEIRKVSDINLPTILEESEFLKMESLQPWKIDQKFQHEDCITELHKFYKSYREKMRKFDILTYQKMYTLGVLHKDPFQHVSSQRSTSPKLKSFISQNIRLLLFKNNSQEKIDPIVKFIKELQCDIEAIYVGQMCLSWEFLHWQYIKVSNLMDSNNLDICTYNEVAGEFQHFQVLLQRFIENEIFEGPRIQYYIKSRYDLRNLLQVPLVREDRMKEKIKARAMEKGEYYITSDMLVEILEESIRIFWKFVRGDKGCSSVLVKGQKGTHQELQSPRDLELLLEVKRSLGQKEKKLKDALRSECCILRRFKKYKEEDSDHVLYIFSQVDMKLVTRVLNMPKLTNDQLVWCHNKLSRISFAHRKIQVNPSFLLFPC